MPASGATPDPSTNPGRLFFPERWPPVVLAMVLLTIAVVVAYLPTFSAPFVFDELPVDAENAAIRHLPWWGELLVGRPSPGAGTWLGHLVNVLIHLTTAVLLFAVARRTLQQASLRARFDADATSTVVALGITICWALHPLQTEAVAASIRRTELLGGFFCLLTLYAFIRAAAPDASRVWPIVAWVACLLGFATSPVAIALPVLALLYDRTFLAGTFAEAWRRRRWLHLALAGTWLTLAWLATRPGGFALTQLHALGLYLKLALWPHPLVLDYGPAVVRPLTEIWPQALLLLALLSITLFALWRRPWLGFVGAWFFATLAPSSIFGPLATQPIAEHRMYLPLAAIVALAVVGLHAAFGRRTVLAVLLLAVVLGIATWQRNTDYTTPVRIWTDTVAKAPTNPRAHYHLAHALSSAGRPADAVSHYETALRLEPRHVAAHFHLAGALLRLERATEAIAHYESAVQLEPRSAETHANLAAALVRLQRMPEAVRHYEAAAKLGMLAAEEQRRFGRALAEVGRVDEALLRLEEAVRLEPRHAESRVLLGMVLSAAGRMPEALRHFTEAVLLQPNDAGARCALADALVELGKPAEAITHYEAALRLQPGQAALVHTSLANAYVRLARVDDAIANYETALRLNPNDTEARENLERVRATALRRGLLRK